MPWLISNDIRRHCIRICRFHTVRLSDRFTFSRLFIHRLYPQKVHPTIQTRSYAKLPEQFQIFKRHSKHFRTLALLLAGSGLATGIILNDTIRNQDHSSIFQDPRGIKQAFQNFKKLCVTMSRNFEHTLEAIDEFLRTEFIEKQFLASSVPLLPDAKDCKHPEGFPTLVVDLNNVLIKMEYTRSHGWRPVVRPGAERFFQELVYHYEIVVWSDDNYPVAQEICAKWGLPIMGALHRDHCLRRKGHYVKDLSLLGRDLERVVIVDHDPNAFLLQPENGILIREFKGEADDRELFAMTDFLRELATSKSGDLRQTLSKFNTSYQPNFIDKWKQEKTVLNKKIENKRQFTKNIFNQQSVSQMKPLHK